MAHDIYLDKCYFGREPAWHMLGNVNEEGSSATEALKAFEIETEYLQPLYYVVDGQIFETAFGMMVRDNGGATMLGFDEVSDLPLRQTWHNLPFKEIAKTWDEAEMPPVDTLGILGNTKGNRMFMTVRLPVVPIVGESYVPYLMFLYSLDGRMAHRYGTTFVRVVCANTLAMALSEGHTMKVRKNSNLLEILPTWFKGAWEGCEARFSAQAEALASLADIPMTDELVQQALEVAVPVGNLILTGDPDTDALREKRYESQLDVADRNRQQVLNCYYGEGETSVAGESANTAYHFYNAYIEWADHLAPARDEKNRAMSALIGAHASHKTNLAKWLLKLTQSN